MTLPIDLVCIGETMAMVTPATVEPLETATDFRVRAGGAESNVAMYLAHAGLSATWVGRLGNDPLGTRVLAEIAAAGVDVGEVELDDEHPTGTYFKSVGAGGTTVHYYRRGSAASMMGPEMLERVAPAARVLHMSGITSALSESCRRLVRAAAARTSFALFSFDVNFRPALWDVKVAAEELRAVAQEADLVFVGLDEAHVLWGTGGAEDVRALLPRPRMLVVKDADVGATEFAHESGAHFVAAPPVDVLESVGAGDAFAAGYLSGLLQGVSASARLSEGHRFAAMALGSTADVAVPVPDPREAHADL